MIAQRFRPLGWAAGVAAAATALYLVSLQVAVERGRLEAVEGQIAAAKRDLRQLQTELGTRASLRQLEAWNGEVLSLAAPKAAQFAGDAAQLTALNLDPADGAAAPPALLAEFTTAPPPPAGALPATKAVPAAVKAPLPAAASPKPNAKAATAPVRTAALTAKPAKVAKPAKPASAERDKSTRVAMIDSRTMADLGRAATTERRPRP
jgi:hypothetical protein